MKKASRTPPFLSPQIRWKAFAQQLSPRDRTALTLAATVFGLTLLWWLALAPALKTLRQAPAQQQVLDTQLQTMQTLAREAQSLQSQPKTSRDETLRALEATTQQRLGASGQLTVLGDRATITFKNAPAEAVAQWLTQTRINAHALPVEARLTRSPARAAIALSPVLPTAAGPGAAPTSVAVPSGWDGMVVLALPAP